MSQPYHLSTSEKFPIDSYPFHHLGHHSRKVTTLAPEAQIWFDRGLAWAAGFNLEEARWCYAEALKWDPQCLMAMWGCVGNCGPHYNNPMVDAPELAEATIAAARALLASPSSSRFTEIERLLMEAMIVRHTRGETREEMDRAYAEEMQKVYEKYPRDVEVIAYTIDALMQLSPWKVRFKLERRRREGRVFALKQGASERGLCLMRTFVLFRRLFSTACFLSAPSLFPQLWKDGKPATGTKTPEILDLLEKGLEIQPNHPLVSCSRSLFCLIPPFPMFLILSFLSFFFADDPSIRPRLGNVAYPQTRHGTRQQNPQRVGPRFRTPFAHAFAFGHGELPKQGLSK